nr:Lrp/AsnC family transcriptional regulator [Skermania piniformis]
MAAAPSLDEVDRLLVEELMADGRATLAALAEKAGLSVSAVQSRVRRLETRGVIRGYSASVDPTVLGLALSAFVALTPLDPTVPTEDVPDRLRGLPAVEACYSVTGAAGYLLLVRAGSADRLEHVLQEIRAISRAGTHTAVVLRTFFER